MKYEDITVQSVETMKQMRLRLPEKIEKVIVEFQQLYKLTGKSITKQEVIWKMCSHGQVGLRKEMAKIRKIHDALKNA